MCLIHLNLENYMKGQNDMFIIAQLPNGVTLPHSTKTIFGA